MRTTTVVIGAGQSGLAMSRCLSDRSIDHVVLERNEVANSWRTERWDSLRLLTPNWQCRLPGYAYDGTDPDGFMTMPEVVDFITGYAKTIAAPVLCGTTVTSVRRTDDGYLVTTDDGEWSCTAVVLATRGVQPCRHVPAFAAAVPSGGRDVDADGVPQRRAARRGRRDGGRRVGDRRADRRTRSSAPAATSSSPSASTCAGRALYRGRDIHWWMEAAGVLDERYDEVDDIVRARRVPSMQLAGSDERATFDLNALTGIGVKLVGRLAGINDGRAQFSGSLRNKCELADLKLGRLLDTIDEWAAANGLDDSVPPPHRFEPTVVDASPPLGLDLTSGEIETIIWATGFRPDYSWLDVDVLDHKGMIRHDGGVVDSPGMYLIGSPVPPAAQVELHRRGAGRRRGPRRRAGRVPRQPRVRPGLTRTRETGHRRAASALRSGNVGTERPPVVRQKGQDRTGPDEDRDLLRRDGHLGHSRTLELGAFDEQGAPAPRRHDHRA